MQVIKRIVLGMTTQPARAERLRKKGHHVLENKSETQEYARGLLWELFHFVSVFSRARWFPHTHTLISHCPIHIVQDFC